MQVLGVLSQDGIMRFVNINTCKMLFDIGALDNRISSVTLSPIGRHIVAIMDSGCINIYCVKALSEDLNQVSCLLIKQIWSLAQVKCSVAASVFQTFILSV